jgi:hypothetical protein
MARFSTRRVPHLGHLDEERNHWQKWRRMHITRCNISVVRRERDNLRGHTPSELAEGTRPTGRVLFALSENAFV